MNDVTSHLRNSKTIYEGRIFTLNHDTVALPDGRVVDMDVVRHRGSVVLLPVPAPDRIILIRQYRYVVNRWLWELPAGSLEPDEAIDAAALRECHEEIGKIAGRVTRLDTLFPSPGFCDEAMTFVLLTELRDPPHGWAAPHQDLDELLTVKEFTIAEAREMARLGEIVDMKTVVGLTMI